MAGLNKLTAIQIKRARPGDKLFDGGGLVCIMGKTGGGKWIFRYSMNGRRREMGLGNLETVTLALARQERARWAAVLQSGLDPIAERDRLKEETERGALDDPTFADMVDKVFEANKEKFREDGGRGRWLSPLKMHVIPKIGHLRMKQIHQTHIQDALRPIWKAKHETANKAWIRTRLVFKQARLMGYDVDPFVCEAARFQLGHVDHTSTPIPATPWQDVPDLYARLCELDSPPAMAVRFTILTAMRGMAIRDARFDEIDGDIWTVPKARMKGARSKVFDFRVPLSSEALAVVEECSSIQRNDFLFPAPRANKGVSDVAMSKVLNKLGEAGRVHGFRTSFRMWVQDTEAASYDVGETALAHVIGNKVERTYARSDLLDPRRILMQKWADFVTQTESKVVRLRS